MTPVPDLEWLYGVDDRGLESFQQDGVVHHGCVASSTLELGCASVVVFVPVCHTSRVFFSEMVFIVTQR